VGGVGGGRGLGGRVEGEGVGRNTLNCPAQINGKGGCRAKARTKGRKKETKSTADPFSAIGPKLNQQSPQA